MFELKWSMDGFDENVNTSVFETEKGVKNEMYRVTHNDGYIVKLCVV